MTNRPSNTQPSSEINVGNRLRNLRAERGYSIRLLAEKSGLNANTLSLIENHKTSPSVSTLQQIAATLQVPITAFFESEATRQNIIFQKAAQRTGTAFTYGSLADMGAGFSQSGMQPFVVTLAPHAKSGGTAIVHTGLEFVYCLEGSLCYDVDGQEFTLEAGDSLLFEAHLPHHWRNAGEIPSRSLLLLCSADERDHPDERHFS